MTGPLARYARRVGRAWHTLRHVPPRQLLRRAELTARFRFGRLVGPAASPAAGLGAHPAATDPASASGPDAAAGRKPGPAPALGRAGAAPAAAVAADGGVADGSTRADGNNLHYMEYLELVDDGLWAELVEDWIAGNPPDGRRRLALCLAALQPVRARCRLARGDSAPPRASAAGTLRARHHVARRAAALSGAASRDRSARQPPDQEHPGAGLGRRLLRRPRGRALDGARPRAAAARARRAGAARRLPLRAVAGLSVPGHVRPARLPGCPPRAAARAGRRAGSDGAGTDPAHAPRRPDRPVQRWRPVHGAVARRVLAVHAGLGGTAAAPMPRAPSRYPTPAISACAARASCCSSIAGRWDPATCPATATATCCPSNGRPAGAASSSTRAPTSTWPARTAWPAAAPAATTRWSIDGAEQSDIYGAFRCGRRAAPMLRSFEADGGGMRLVGSHDGYDHLPGSPRHVRTIDARPGTVEILDRIEGGGQHAAIAHLLLHPDCKVDARGETATIRSGPVTVRLAASAPLTVAAGALVSRHLCQPADHAPGPAGADGRDRCAHGAHGRDATADATSVQRDPQLPDQRHPDRTFGFDQGLHLGGAASSGSRPISLQAGVDLGGGDRGGEHADRRSTIGSGVPAGTTRPCQA